MSLWGKGEDPGVHTVPHRGECMCGVGILGRSSMLSWTCRKAATTSAQKTKGWGMERDIEWAVVGDVAGDAGGCQTTPDLEDHVKNVHK